MKRCANETACGPNETLRYIFEALRFVKGRSPAYAPKMCSCFVINRPDGRALTPSEPLRAPPPSEPLRAPSPSEPLRASSPSEPLRASSPSEPPRAPSPSELLRAPSPSEPLRAPHQASRCERLDQVSRCERPHQASVLGAAKPTPIAQQQGAGTRWKKKQSGCRFRDGYRPRGGADRINHDAADIHRRVNTGRAGIKKS